MLAAPAGPAPRTDPLDRRLTVAGIAVSIALHLLGAGAVALARAPHAPAPPSFTVIDLETAPVAPAAEALPPEEAVDPAAVAPTPPVPVEPPPVDPDGFGRLDAGVDAAPPLDAAVDAAADARRARDAGVDAATEPLDAGVDAPLDGGELVATAGPDGGLDGSVATVDSTGDGGVGSDGGTVATTGEADPSGSTTAKPSAGTAANLLSYAPTGHVVTLLARMDRLRGTEWADRVEAMLAPLPDHDALIGKQPVRITDLFETLVITTPEPERADATTLVGRTAMPPATLRDLLDQPDAPVSWSPTKSGALGRRLPSPRVIPGDERVFLAWAPGWVTLARPGDLGGDLQPAIIGLDHAFAAPDAVPPWLARVATIEDESGTDTGPALMVTAGGMFPDAIDVPLVDVDIPGPDRATLTLTVEANGFTVRGNLRYASDSAAATAADALVRVQRSLASNPLAKIGLSSARAWNAIKGLTVQRTGSRVSFATSISTGDGRVLLARVSDLIAARFAGSRRPRRPPPSPSPSAPSTPSPSAPPPTAPAPSPSSPSPSSPAPAPPAPASAPASTTP